MANRLKSKLKSPTHIENTMIVSNQKDLEEETESKRGRKHNYMRQTNSSRLKSTNSRSMLNNTTTTYTNTMSKRLNQSPKKRMNDSLDIPKPVPPKQKMWRVISKDTVSFKSTGSCLADGPILEWLWGKNPSLADARSLKHWKNSIKTDRLKPECKILWSFWEL